MSLSIPHIVQLCILSLNKQYKPTENQKNLMNGMIK